MTIMLRFQVLNDTGFPVIQLNIMSCLFHKAQDYRVTTHYKDPREIDPVLKG
jgi:hypothetical protein